MKYIREQSAYANIEQFLEKESGCLKDSAASRRAYFLLIVLGAS